MDQGIIQCLKKYYRESLLKRMILNIDNGRDYEVNLLSAIHLAAAAWDLVTPLTISNCFRHAGFSQPCDSAAAAGQDLADLNDAVPGAAGNSNVIEDFSVGDDLLAALRTKECRIPENVKFSDLVCTDSQLECYEDETDDLILERALQSADDAAELSSGDEEPSNKTKVSIKEAVQATETLKAFFETKENSEEWLQMLRKVECEVLQTCDVLQQAKITSFFSKQD